MPNKNIFQMINIIILFSLFILLGCKDKNKPASDTSKSNIELTEKIDLPQYTIVDEDIHDARVKTQVEQHIVVSGDINETNLQALLNKQHNLISKRTGFKYHQSPTNVYIYIYETKEKALAGQGLWLELSQMSYGDIEPQITVKTDQLNRLGKEPQLKFGLTEVKRKEVFSEIARVEKKATDVALKRFPSDINKQIDLERDLQEKYKDEVAAKYKLNREQLKSIVVEGLTNQRKY